MDDCLDMIERCSAHQPIPSSICGDLSVEQRNEISGKSDPDLPCGQYLDKSDLGINGAVPLEEVFP